MEIINDKALLEEIISDLVDHYSMPEDKARVWAEQHGSSIVDDMWEAYSNYLQDFHDEEYEELEEHF